MNKTIFEIPKMDCPSEEGLIRMALEKNDKITKLSFDLRARRLEVNHQGSQEEILAMLAPLNFGAKIVSTAPLNEADEDANSIEDNKEKNAVESKVLKQLLAINGVMFVVELASGIFAESAGLIADSMDMFADAAVYSLSLFAVGKAVSYKSTAAKASGYLQLLLALGALTEVLRRTIFGADPEPPYMIGIATLALIANVTCLLLLSRHRDGEVHMKASWIFSTNDVIANAGVIVAGVLVLFTKSHIPDLIVGACITFVVFRGAIRILRLASAEAPS